MIDINAVFQNKWIKYDYLIVVAIGIVLLFVSHLTIYREVALVDEVMYVVVGRNIVEQGTLDTNLYWTESLVRRGYPTRDYHTPGYMLTLAAFFAIFGFNNVVVGLPAKIAYILAGALFYRVGKSLFNPMIALLATLLFYIYPINFVYASLVMVEVPFALLAVIYLALWVKISRAQKIGLLDIVLLGVVIIGGMLYRQTFVIFLPPTLFLLSKFGIARNYRPLITFSLLFLFFFLGVFWPLTQNRSYYPNVYDRIIEAADWPTKVTILQTTFFNSLSQIFRPLPIQRDIALIHLILGIVSILGLWQFKERSQRLFALLFFYLFWGSLAAFSALYKSPVDLTVARNLAAFMLPGILLFVAILFQIKQKAITVGLFIIFVIFVGFATLRFAQNAQRWQDDALRTQQKFADIFTEYLQPYAPRSIIFERGFKLAWTHYPMTVVADIPTTYDQMQEMQKHLSADIIVVSSEEMRDVIREAVGQGLIERPYSLLFPYEVEGYYFFINEQLLTNEAIYLEKSLK